jgi:hypothetical protein
MYTYKKGEKEKDGASIESETILAEN